MRLIVHRMSVLFCLLFSLSVSTVAHAQSEAGSAAVEGVVSSPDNRGVSGAAVTVRNKETGYTRTINTNDAGHFMASVLPVGIYVVEVKASGFALSRRDMVTLTVGRTETVDLKLQLATVSQEITVTAEGPSIDTEDGAAGASVSQRAIAELPIRGRNFTDFIQLTPGIVQESDRKGLVIAGQRSINSNIAVDGADFNDALQGNQRGGNDAIFSFPQTAIREFQVVRSGVTAEVGRTGAGFVNAVTKSGTNIIHGETFFLNRNPRLTAHDAFDNKGQNQQNQFGGSIGGPIKRDKAFFFIGAEQNFLHIPYFVRFATPAAGLTVPAEVANLAGEHISTNNPTAVFARTDYTLSQNNTLNVQYTFSRFRGENFGALADGTVLTDNFASTNYKARSSSNGIKAALVSIIGSGIVNEVRGQYATDYRNEDPNSVGPEIRVDNYGRFGNSGSRPRLYRTERFQISDNITFALGKNQLRAGVDVNVNNFEAERQSDYLGTWRFNSLADFINGIPRRLTQTIVVFPDEIVAKGQQQEMAVFLQDRVKLSRSLTFNAGIRWEGQWNPKPPHANPALPETGFIPNDLGMWQPRLGLAWDADNKGTTVFRLSAGLYDSRTPATLFHRVFNNNDLVTKDYSFDERSGACRTATGSAIPANCVFRGSGAILNYPNILTAVPTLPSGISNRVQTRAFGFKPDFKNPRTLQTAFTLEQRLSKDTTMSLGFIHNSAWFLQRRVDRNLNAPTIDAATGYPVFPTTRPNGSLGIFSVNESSAHSRYEAFVLDVQHRFAHRFQIGGTYTVANNKDDDSNERNFSRETTLSPFDLKAELGPSKQDVRNNLTLNSVVDMSHGFTLGTILMMRSGFPYTAVVGDDVQGDGNTDNDRAVINGKVVGRNSFRQPSFFNLDLRLMKAFTIGEEKKLSFTAELFNATRALNKNFGVDSISIYGNAGNGLTTVAPPTVFPRGGEAFTAPSTARFGGPRQLQLGARLTF